MIQLPKPFHYVCHGISTLPMLFWLPAGLTMLMALSACWHPQYLAQLIRHLNSWVFQTWGSLYLIFALAVLCICIIVSISPVGQLRLGQSDEKPAFDFFSWFAMLFCAGMGTGFMFWGGAEPLYHFQYPPLLHDTILSGVVPDTGTLSPHSQAFAFTFFHWGITPWAIYALTALAIGFFCFNQGKPMRFSAFIPVRSAFRSFLDLIAMLAFLFGIAATFGMGVLIIEGGLQVLFGLTPSVFTKLSIVAAITIVFLVSAFRGLNKGIKWLSNTSVTLTCLLMLTMLLLGPTKAIIHSLVEGMSAYATLLPKMNLGLLPFAQDDWLRNWTLKYWSWWIAWAPFVGTFVALISRGRTIRELMLGVILIPSLFSFMWFAIMGQSAIQLYEAELMSGIQQNFSNAQTIWHQLIVQYSQSTWLAGWLSLLSLLMIGVFICDSADSAAYTMACLSQKHLTVSHEDPTIYEPKLRLILAWGLLFAALALVLLLSGGIQVLQEVTLISVLPFTLLLTAVFINLIPALVQALQINKSVTPSLAFPSQSTQESSQSEASLEY